MELKTQQYLQAIKAWPAEGQHILAQQDSNQIVVYQAYNNNIAEYAVANQKLGGPHFSYGRMSWIKPNFLWMMYRCGWASKPNQESILAITISKNSFDHILRNAAFSSFNEVAYLNAEEWKDDLLHKPVRLQWDPDHDPFGNKEQRRAIQLGLKGHLLEAFGKEQIIAIEDITGFVREQKRIVDSKQLNELLVPVETPYVPEDKELCRKIGLEGFVSDKYSG